MREAFANQYPADVPAADQQRSTQAPKITITRALLSWPTGASHAD